MRMIVIIGLIVLVLAVAGWIGFRSGDGSASVEIKTDKIQDDTSEVIRNTREWIGEPATP